MQPGRSVLARTQKAGAWSAPESGSPRSFDEPQRFHGAARYRCSPDRPVNAGRFLLQMLFLPVPIRTTARDLLQLQPGHSVLVRTQKAGA
nr:hypothetical protein [Bacillus velezensis]